MPVLENINFPCAVQNHLSMEILIKFAKSFKHDNIHKLCTLLSDEHIYFILALACIEIEF